MSALQTLKSILGLGTTDDAPNELDVLYDLLAEREAELTLSAEYGQPYPNTCEEPTVVFPYTLYTSNGAEYGAGAKEFVIPDDGLQDASSPLAQFIAQRLDIEAADVDFDSLVAVEGTTADAELDESGDVHVGVGA